LIADFEDDRDASWRKHFSDELSKGLPRYQKLICRLYTSEEPLLKMEAAALFPTNDKSSGIKYLNIAEQRGWIRFSSDQTDGRKVKVIPTYKLVQMTEAYLAELASLLVQVRDELQAIKAPPP